MSSDDISWRRVGRPSPADRLDWRPHRGSAARPGMSERLGAGRTPPQAVVRVLSYRRGAGAVARTAAYVTRKAGERFVIEGDLELTGRDALLDAIGDWSRDFTARANGRDAVHLELSAPPGHDRDRVFAAVRAFAEATFGERHQYVLADHRDTPHPHAHLLVKLRGSDGRQLDPRKGELAQWREAFAKAACREGVPLAASSCRERGVKPRGMSRAALEVRRRGTELAAEWPRTGVGRIEPADLPVEEAGEWRGLER